MLSKEEKINSVLTKIAKIVDPVIEKLLNFYVDPKYRDIVKYQIFTGGKRLRPALAIVCCRLFGGKINDVLYPAAGCEILHNYSLILDDIVDEGPIRRNRITLWQKYGKAIAECISIDYVASAFEAANHSKYSKEISELYVNTAKTAVNGEILDLLFETKERKNEPYLKKKKHHQINVKDYLKIVGMKTAVVFQACCEIGGICARANKEELENLRKFGFNLGIAGQIRDDILDIFGKREKFGKEITHDIKEGKLGNIVIVYALEKIGQNEKENLLKIMKDGNLSENEIKRAVEIIEESGALKKAQKLAERFASKAKNFSKIFPENKWKKILLDLSDFMVERYY